MKPESVTAVDLIPHRHKLLVETNGCEPFWCSIASVSWSDDASMVSVMLDNHCFVNFRPDENVQVCISHNDVPCPIRLPRRREYINELIYKAKIAIEEAEKDLSEAKERLRLLELVK